MGRIASFRDLGCLVTGASSGIGRDLARLLADEGARLVITARRRERLDELAEELRSRGAAETHVVAADLAEPEAPEALARAAEEHLGHVDVLVNNAGFGVAGSFGGCDLDRTLRMIRVNVSAHVDLTRRLLPGMIRRDRGGVLTVASMAGYQAAPYQSAYAGTKGFLLLWSDGLHQEYAHTGLAVTALNPGVTDTEFFEAAGYKRLTGFLKHRMASMKVAAVGLRAFRKGKMEVVPGFLNKGAIFLQRLFSRRMVASLSRRLMGGRSPPRRKAPSDG
jgi:short-subunit dehydrogenase